MRPLLLFLTYSLFTVHSAHSVPLPIKLIKMDGLSHRVTVTSPEITKLSFAGVSKGNISSSLKIKLTAPSGAMLKVREATLTETIERQLNRPRSFWNLLLRNENILNHDAKMCIGFSPGEGSAEGDDTPTIEKPTSNDPLCQLFSSEELSMLAAALTSLYGGSWNAAQVCGYIVSQYKGGAECDPVIDPICKILESRSDPETLKAVSGRQSVSQQYYGVLTKDACASNKARYLLVFDIDLSKVPPERRQNASINLQVIERVYEGNKAASIKPKSEGKFAPQPILLMSYAGSFCGQKLNVSKWSKKKPATNRTLRVEDLIPYNGNILTRTPIVKVLSGGKGTFELYTGEAAYGVCFNLVARRQKVNGY